MRRLTYSILATLVILFAVSPNAAAKKSDVKTSDLYVFAISFSFSDSIMYMSSVQKLENMTIREKYFLDERADLAGQFKKWVEEETSSQQIATLYYFDKKKKADAKYSKVCERAIKKHEGTIVTVPDFWFTK